MSFGQSELWDAAARRDPHAFYARVRKAGGPVAQIEPATGNRFWVVARHADVREGLLHPAIGHEVHRHLPEQRSRREHEPTSEAERIASRQLIALDPPDHTRLRRLVNTAFSPRTVARLEPRIVEVVDDLLARARTRGVIDGVADLGDPVPVAVIADLVGVPEEDRPRFRAWSSAMISASPDYERATLEFAAFIDELAERRRADPEEDLLSELVALEHEGDALDRDELVAMVQLLLIAGQETTVYVIATGLLALLTHPDQWRALREDPSLAPAAVEEILRFDGPVEIAPPRFTFEELELAGGTIPAFETVALSILGANRDPEVFSDPDVFDVRRADARQHIAFGHGIHFCVGAPLARLEGRIMFERIAEQLPDLRLAVDPTELRRTKQRLAQLPLLV
jgi:cytochrome P450